MYGDFIRKNILPKLASVTMGGSKEGIAHLASSKVNAFGFHFRELAIPPTQNSLVKKWLTTYARYCNGNLGLVSAVCEMGGRNVIFTKEYRKTKISSLRNTSTPISKTAGIEKIFLRKILCRKNKKSPISRNPQPPQLRVFLRPKSDKQKCTCDHYKKYSSHKCNFSCNIFDCMI